MPVPTKPRAPVWKATGADSATISWIIDQDDITLILIQYTVGTLRSARSIPLPADNGSIELTGLPSGDGSATITLRNRDGDSILSDAGTLRRQALGKPVTPTLVVSGPTEIYLIWFVSSPGVPLLELRISYNDGNSQIRTVQNPSESGSELFTVDAVGTRLTARIAFRTVFGWSPDSDSVSAVSANQLPSPPRHVTATPGDSAITVTWQPPTQNVGIIDYEYRRRTFSGAYGSWTTTGTTSGSFTDTDVSNGTEYYYQVRARNVTGPSEASEESNGATPVADVAPTEIFSSTRQLVVRPKDTTTYRVTGGGVTSTVAAVSIVAPPNMGGVELSRITVELGHLTQYGVFIVEEVPNYIYTSLKWEIRAHVETDFRVTLRAATLSDAQKYLHYSAVRVRRQRGSVVAVDFTGFISPRGAWIREEGQSGEWVVDLSATSLHRQAGKTLLVKTGKNYIEGEEDIELALDWDLGVNTPDGVSSPAGFAVETDGETWYYIDRTTGQLYTRVSGVWSAGEDGPEGESLPSGLAWSRYENELFLIGNSHGKIWKKTPTGWSEEEDGPGVVAVLGLTINIHGNPVTTDGTRIYTLGDDGNWTSIPGPEGTGGLIFDVDVLDNGTLLVLTRSRIWIRDVENRTWVPGAGIPSGESAPIALESRGTIGIYLLGASSDKIYTSAIPTSSGTIDTPRIYGTIGKTLYHRLRPLADHARLRAAEFGPVILVDARDWPNRALEVRSSLSRPLSYLDAVKTAAASLGDGWQIDGGGKLKPLLHEHFPVWFANPTTREWGFEVRGTESRSPNVRGFQLTNTEKEVSEINALHQTDGNADYSDGRVILIGKFGAERHGENVLLVRMLVLDPGGAGARYPLPALADPVLDRISVVRYGTTITPSGGGSLSARVGEVDEDLPGIWSMSKTHLSRLDVFNPASVTSEGDIGAAQRNKESGWRFAVVVDIVDRVPALTETRLKSFSDLQIGRRFEIVGAGSQTAQQRIVALRGHYYIDSTGNRRAAYDISAIQASALSHTTEGLELFREIKDQLSRDGE